MKVTTRAQRKALHRLWLRGKEADSWKAELTYLQFRRRFKWCYGDYIFGSWLGMWFGIELDGYTHT